MAYNLKKYSRAVGKRNRLRLSQLVEGDKFQFLKGRKTYTVHKAGRFIPSGVVMYQGAGQTFFVEPEKAKRIVVYRF